MPRDHWTRFFSNCFADSFAEIPETIGAPHAFASYLPVTAESAIWSFSRFSHYRRTEETLPSRCRAVLLRLDAAQSLLRAMHSTTLHTRLYTHPLQEAVVTAVVVVAAAVVVVAVVAVAAAAVDMEHDVTMVPDDGGEHDDDEVSAQGQAHGNSPDSCSVSLP